MDSWFSFLGCTRYSFMPFSWALGVLFYYLTFSEFSGRGFSAWSVSGLFFVGWIGGGFCVLCPAYPPRSVSGLVWVIGPLICGTGPVSGVVDWVQMVLVVFGVIFLLVFGVHFSLFRRHFLTLPPLRAAWRWPSLTVSSSPLLVGYSFLSFFFDVPCRLRYLAVQRCRSGF